MASNTSDETIRLLKALAFHIHKKEPAVEALTRCFEDEGRSGRHRKWREPAAVLETHGFVPALRSADLVSEDAACLLAVIEKAGDHRLLSAALTALAEHLDHG